jgi:catalase
MLDAMTQDHLVDNIVGHLQPVPLEIRARAVEMFRRADGDFGDRVEKGLANSPFPASAASGQELVEKDMVAR